MDLRLTHETGTITMLVYGADMPLKNKNLDFFVESTKISQH